MLTYTLQKWPETLKTTRTSTNTDRLGKSPVYEKQRVLKFRETVEPDGTCRSVRINRVSILSRLILEKIYISFLFSSGLTKLPVIYMCLY